MPHSFLQRSTSVSRSSQALSHCFLAFLQRLLHFLCLFFLFLCFLARPRSAWARISVSASPVATASSIVRRREIEVDPWKITSDSAGIDFSLLWAFPRGGIR